LRAASHARAAGVARAAAKAAAARARQEDHHLWEARATAAAQGGRRASGATAAQAAECHRGAVAALCTAEAARPFQQGRAFGHGRPRGQAEECDRSVGGADREHSQNGQL